MSCDRSTGRWSIGAAVADLAAGLGVEQVIFAGHSVLRRLSAQTGETASLAVLRGEQLRYVDEVTPDAVLSASWLGQSVPLHATSTGKALLAFMATDAVERLMRLPLAAYTDTTITDPEALTVELARTRDRGFGTCVGELESSLSGVSAPILGAGGPLAVLSIWGPRTRLPVERLPELGALVVPAAAEIAARGRGESPAATEAPPSRR